MCLRDDCDGVVLVLVVFWPHSPHKEAEEAEQRVHEPHVVRDAGDNGLLTVRTHGVHRRRLEHLPLQHRHRGGGRVTSHVDKLTGTRTRTHLSCHWMKKVTRWRVDPTCGSEKISNPETEINQQAQIQGFYGNCWRHLVEAWAWAWAWEPLLEHVEEWSLAVGLHTVEDRNLEEKAAQGQEQFLLQKNTTNISTT